MPTDERVVQTAAEAAEDVIFSRIKQSNVEDYDVRVTFEDAVLEVDVYIQASDAEVDEERVADDAALSARAAVDDLFADE
jgi:hypothetical protein